MAKKLIKNLKLVAPAAKATPAPPLGPALGAAGVNISDFVQKFNAASQEFAGQNVSVKVRVYDDRSYDFEVKTPITSELIFKAMGIPKGSSKNRVTKVGKVKKSQLQAIAETKMRDLNAKNPEGALKILMGTCRSSGIEVVEG